jgi:hypothetical protein
VLRNNLRKIKDQKGEKEEERSNTLICNTPNPTAPRPRTATLDPFSTLASLQADPNPVENPHERKLA